MSSMPCEHSFEGHAGRIFSIAICAMPDGRQMVASASHDRSVRIWSIEKRNLPFGTTVPAPVPPPLSMSASTGSGKGGPLPPPPVPGRTRRYTHDFQHVRTLDYTDFVWRVFIVHSYHSLTNAPQTCSSESERDTKRSPMVVAFIPTEERIQVNDLVTGEVKAVFHGRLLFAGMTPMFAQGVVLTAVGEEDLSFIDVNTGAPLCTISGGFEKAFRAVVAPGPTATSNPIVAFTTWNVQNRRSTIQTYEVCPKATPVAGTNTGTDGQPQGVVYECEREKMSILFEGDSRDGVTSLVVTTGVKPVICSGHYDFLIRLWCIETRQLIMTLDGHSDYVGSVAAWRGPEPLFVSGSSDGTIKAWSTQTGALIATGEGHTRDIWAVAVTFGKRPLIVSGSFDRTLKVWDLNDTLCDLSWERRRLFCWVIHRCFKSASPSDCAMSTLSPSLSATDYGLGEKFEGLGVCDSENERETQFPEAMRRVFGNIDLCSVVASFI